MKRTIITFFSFLVVLALTTVSVTAGSGRTFGTLVRAGCAMALGGSVSINSGGFVLSESPPPSPYQRVDPFYIKLLEEGKEAWRQGDRLGAIEKLEVAYFGFLKSPSHLIETGIYLIVCHFEVNHNERAAYFDSEINALGAPGSLEVEAHLSEFDLPPDLLERYHEAHAYFARQKVAGQYHPGSGQDAAPLMKSEALTSTPKSPYTRIAELEQLIDRNRNNTAAYLEIASLYLEYNNPKMAKPVLRRLLEIDPDNAAGRFELGKTHLALEEYREAAAAFELAGTVLDGDIEFHYQKGAAHYMSREFDAARREFERVRSLHAGYKLTEDYLIELERLTGSENAAESIPAETAVSRPSEPSGSELKKQQIKMEQAKPQTQTQTQTRTEAQAQTQQTQQTPPTQPTKTDLLKREEPQKQLGLHEPPSRTQAQEQAQTKAQTQAVQTQTSHASPSKPDYIELARREGKLKKKIQYYMEALRQDPSQIEIYFEMTGAYRSEKKYREAAGLLEYLLQYLPDDQRIYVELADLYVLCKYHDKAIDFCEQALTLFPDDLDISYGLARAFMGKKRYARAASEFRKILQVSPEFKDAPSLFETCRNKIK